MKGGVFIKEIIGLRSKSHATEIEDDEQRYKKDKLNTIKSKDIRKHVVEDDIIFQD